MLKQVGNYTLTEKIGCGALSRVYRAIDQQGRPVAIKLSTSPAEAEQLDHLQKDLVAAAGVLHPNVVAIYDLGFEDDLPYLVMEFVEGCDFYKILKSGKGAAARRQGICAMLQVAEALKAAHDGQVFHLDVRPSKIMRSYEGASKLLGLGLGRLSYDPGRVTDRGYLVGSPLYMSPERLAAIEVADAQCDIWSFGVTLYELVAGKHPFYNEDGDRMIANIIVDQPAPLAGVSSSLNQVIFRALEKDPANRYQSFAELLAEIKPIVSELQREESATLMAQALQETDSGRWQEARRTARKLCETNNGETPDSPILEFAESEPEPPVIAEAPEVEAAGVAPASRPDPPSVQAPPVPLPKAPPLERTAQKIPANGARHSAARRENGSPAVTRVPSNLVNYGFGVAPETRAIPPPRAVAKRRRRRHSGSPSSTRTVLTQPPVRVLEFSGSPGLPWGKIAGVAAVGLLAAGLSFFFLRQPNGLVTAVNASNDVKTASPAGRVIKPSKLDQPVVSAFSQTTGDLPVPAPADLDVSSDSLVTPPRPFDPKSLVVRKIRVRRPVSSMASLSPPSLSGSVFVADSANLPPVAFNAPPPPVQTSSPATHAAAAAFPQSVVAAHSPANHLGGSFKEPSLVYSVRPVYPSPAIQRKTQGIVRFQATISKDGSLKSLQLISGDPLLNAAAKQAVSQWRYRPATLNGEPIEVTQAIIVKFNLDQ